MIEFMIALMIQLYGVYEYTPAASTPIYAEPARGTLEIGTLEAGDTALLMGPFVGYGGELWLETWGGTGWIPVAVSSPEEEYRLGELREIDSWPIGAKDRQSDKSYPLYIPQHGLSSSGKLLSHSEARR